MSGLYYNSIFLSGKVTTNLCFVQSKNKKNGSLSNLAIFWYNRTRIGRIIAVLKNQKLTPKCNPGSPKKNFDHLLSNTVNDSGILVCTALWVIQIDGSTKKRFLKKLN